MTAAERLSWLRRLLEDVPVIERETSTADGTSTDFILRNPPVRAVLGVWVDGAQQTVGTAFSLVDAEVVRFTRPPTAASSVVMVYDRQTFDDAELVQYLDVAAVDWTRDLGIVYAAGCLALDALLLGSATALRFGAGAEEANLPSVFDRLTTVRAQWGGVLAREAQRPAVFGEPSEPALLARALLVPTVPSE